MPALRSLSRVLRLLLDGRDTAVGWRLLASTCLAVTGGALAGAAPLALKEMIDVTVHNAPAHPAPLAVAAFGAAYLLCLCIGRLLAELRPLLHGQAAQRLYSALRRRYFAHLLALPLDFHLGRRTGALVHDLQQAISGYQVILFCLVNSLAPGLVEALTLTLVLVSLGQPALTATFAVAALAHLLVLRSRTAGISAAAQAVSAANAEVHAALADSLISYEPIKCYGAERTAAHHFDQSARQLERGWTRLQHQRLRQGLGTVVVFATMMTIALVLSTQSVLSGSLSMGGFVLANLYMVQVARPLEMLSASVRELVQSLAFIRPLLDTLEARTETVQPPDRNTSVLRTDPVQPQAPVATASGRPSPGIQFRGVQLVFPNGKQVLNQLDLEIPAGHSTALVGASGSGKSSLVRLLLRLVHARAGHIRLNGMDIEAMPLSALRSMIAVVPQDVVLFDATVADNIGMGKEGAMHLEIERAARLAGLQDFISALPHGYDTRIGERGLMLSGGERQRIAIARAILRDPLIYVFDEATSMLDMSTERAIMRNLAGISAGRTTLTIAHRLSTVKHADHIAVIAEGRIVEQGVHSALLARNGVYATLWQAQLAGHPS